MNRNTIKGWITKNKRPSISHNSLQFIKNGRWGGVAIERYEIPQLIPTGGRSKGIVSFDMKVWLSFLGWYLSEGCLGGYCKESTGDYIISIRQMDRGSMDEIASIVRNMGFRPNVRYEHGTVLFHSKEMHEHLKQFGYAKDKFIPTWLKNLPPEYLHVLLDSLFKGDGSHIVSSSDRIRDTYEGGLDKYYTISQKLAEDVAEIALKCGYGISIHRKENFSNEFTASGGSPVGTRYNDIYIVGISHRNLTPRITIKPEVVQYNGFVYDVTVQNHILLVERNGKIVWSGNSYDGGTEADTVARLYKWIPFAPGDDLNIVDAALAMPLDQNDVSPYILINDFDDLIQVRGVRSVTSKIPVKKYSRTTDTDRGTVIDWDFTVAVDYEDGRTHNFTDQILIQIETEGGDSGSILLDEDNYAVGLVFAGGTDSSGQWFGVANKIRTVLAMFGGDIDISEGLTETSITEPKPQHIVVTEMATATSVQDNGLPLQSIAIAGIGVIGAFAVWQHLNKGR